jgi:parvulin-like peptidyl-prolyl isomerase
MIILVLFLIFKASLTAAESLDKGELLNGIACYTGSASILTFYELKKYYPSETSPLYIEEEELIINLSESLDLTLKEEEFSELIERMRAKFAKEEDFLAALKKEGFFNIEELKEFYKRQQMKYKLWEQEIIPLVTIKEATIKDLYKRASYKFSLSHILLSSYKSAKEVYLKLKENSFSDIARIYSLCPSSKDGGFLGTYTYIELDPNIAEVAFLLPPGTISSIITTNLGFHIIKVEAKSKLDQQTTLKNLDLLIKRKKSELQKKWLNYIIEEGREKFYIRFIL